MQTFTFVVRILLGLVLVVFPINALFIKAFKPKMPEKAQAVMTAFSQTGYLLTFVQVTELVVGIALLTGYFTPLALLILLPISVNILLFHTYLAPPVVGPGLFIFLMNIFLIYSYKEHYINILTP